MGSSTILSTLQINVFNNHVTVLLISPFLETERPREAKYLAQGHISCEC